jgi:broad specificity phosphatase PhoE
MTFQERKSAFPDNNYSKQDDIISVNKRVMDGLDEINQKYHGGKVLLVAHGAVISVMLANLSSGEIGSGKTRLKNGTIMTYIFIKNNGGSKHSIRFYTFHTISKRKELCFVV